MVNGEPVTMIKNISYDSDNINFSYEPNKIKIFLNEICYFDGYRYRPMFDANEFLDKLYYDNGPRNVLPSLARQMGQSTFLLFLAHYYMYVERASVLFLYAYDFRSYEPLIDMINVHKVDFNFKAVYQEMTLKVLLKGHEIELGTTNFTKQNNNTIRGITYDYIIIDDLGYDRAAEDCLSNVYPLLVKGGKVIISPKV